MVNYRELLEDSYDNIEEEGYRNYNENEEEFINDEEDEESQNDDNQEEDLELYDEKDKLSDWEKYGLGKMYEEEFDLNKTYEMFAEDSIRMQMEAIRYATFFARGRNVDAQNFIIAAIQMKNLIDDEVHQLALTSFTLFFRNFVRVQCNKYYARIEFSNDYEKLERIKEAVEECFVMIYKEIYRYDSSAGRLSTFFTKRILGCITSFEAEMRGRASKQTMSVDKKVSNIEISLRKRGINPTVRRIALEMDDKNVEKIYNSAARIEAENTMLSIEADQTKTGICNRVEQVRFETPEGFILKSEASESLMLVLNSLSDVEREILLRMNNMTISGGQIIDIPESEMGDIYTVARTLNMKSGDVKRIYINVVSKIKDNYGIKKGNDKLLEGRGFIFANSEKDVEVDSFLDEITAIF